MGDDQAPTPWDQANDGVNGAGDGLVTYQQFLDTYEHFTDPTHAVTGADFLRPLGLQYDAPDPPPGAATAGPGSAAVGESEIPGGAAGEKTFLPGEAHAPSVAVPEGAPPVAVADAAAAPGVPTGPEISGLDAAAGALGIVGGGLQAYGGYNQFVKGGEANHIDGAEEMLAGGSNAVAGGLGLATALGATGGIAAASAVAAPVAAAIGLAVTGDHQAEAMGLWGTDAEGHQMGTVEAAWNESQHLGDQADKALGGGTLGLIGGAATAGLSTAVLETGAVAADIGLGLEAGGASTGLLGSTQNYTPDADGTYGTHNMGAFEALGHYSHEAGDGVDSALGIDKDSTGGRILSGAVTSLAEGAGAGVAAAVDVAGIGYSGVKAAGGALDSAAGSFGLFGTATGDDGTTHNMGAFEALDHAGQAAGSGVDNLLGLDQKSTAGRIVGDVTEGVVDVAGAGYALAADVGLTAAKGVEVGAEALWHGAEWLGGEEVKAAEAVGGAIADGAGAVVDGIGDAASAVGGWVSDLF